ncbi:hypothetical protein [Phenylobacterium sp.]|jgi:hypothetical protein|uniref:hypothetical protein n=1 Tax=Phenylobacterium sp. TaxID=1871053 RepID=UPI002F40BF0F
MANAALSNRARRQLLKTIAPAPRHPRVGEAGQGVRVSADPAPPADRDGLVWLGEKKRLTPDQLKAAFHYRDAFRDAGEVSLKSALDVGVGGGGYGPATPSPLVSLTTARRALLVIRYQVLRGQVDMLTVMDGVCGAGHTLRGLAGGDKHRARDLEILLKAALDQVVAFRCVATSGA